MEHICTACNNEWIQTDSHHSCQCGDTDEGQVNVSIAQKDTRNERRSNEKKEDKRTMSSNEVRKNKPSNSAFKQQRLKAWQPILTPAVCNFDTYV